MWPVLANKILTSDNLQKRSWKDPNIYTLSRENGESVLHLFLYCHFIKTVWDVVKTIIWGKGNWTGDDMESPLENWLDNNEEVGYMVYLRGKKYSYLPK